MTNKILLINPNRMKPPVAPVALDYLSHSLMKHGFNVSILDLCFSEDIENDLRKSINSYSPDAIGLTIRNTDDCYLASRDFFIPEIKKLVREIKKITDVPVILGGVGFSVMPDNIVGFCGAHYGIIGEGEEFLPYLLHALSRKIPLKNIPNLMYKSGSFWNTNRTMFLDLKKICLSARGYIDNLRYFKEGGMAGFESKRGCNQKCIYCADPVSKGRKIRMRAAGDVASEIENLYNMGITHFHTCDSEFNIPVNHATEVCNELINKKLSDKIRWYAYCCPVPFSKDFALLMKKAGCAGIDFGVDSGNDSILTTLRRNFTKSDIIETAKICNEIKLPFMYDLLLGGPGETNATSKETIDLMKKISPSRVGISLGIRIYPNTELGIATRGVIRYYENNSNEENCPLKGELKNNENLRKPIFYLSDKINGNPTEYIKKLIGDDKRFFIPSTEAVDSNYNYNDNSVLVQAIKNGYRGAFWDILRRLSDGED